MLKRVSITYQNYYVPQAILSDSSPGLMKAKALIARLIDHAQRVDPCNEEDILPGTNSLTKFFLRRWLEGRRLRGALIEGHRMTIFVGYSPAVGQYLVRTNIYRVREKEASYSMEATFDDNDIPGYATVSYR